MAFIIQTYAQKHTSSTHCGIIFTLEPVFASICAYIFIGEVLNTRGYIGAVILFLSMMVAELDLSTLFKKPSYSEVKKEVV